MTALRGERHRGRPRRARLHHRRRRRAARRRGADRPLRRPRRSRARASCAPSAEGSFAADPLRLLRAARLAAELGLEIDPGTVALARAAAARAAEPAGERQLAELRQLLGGPDPLRGLALLDELRLTAVVLPELEACAGSSRARTTTSTSTATRWRCSSTRSRSRRDLDRFAGERRREVAALLAEPLADEMTRGTALRFGALLHDIGKPATRGERDGFVGFPATTARGPRSSAGSAPGCAPAAA